MARPIWKGSISFGLVNIPVTLHAAERPHELHFTLLDSRNKARVKYRRVNEATGKDVPWNDIVKGYKIEDDYVILRDKDFKNAAVEASQTVDILDFVNGNEIDQIYYDRPYYLMPDKKGEKGYSLLRETLKRTNKVAIGKVVIRTREHLASVFPEGDALVLNLMRFDHEIVKPGDIHIPKVKQKVSPKEVQLAEQLVNSMSSDWKPAKYKDDYYDSLMAYIKKKAKAGDTEIPPQGETETRKERGVINMMDLLEKSVATKGRKAPAKRKRGKVIPLKRAA